MPLGYIQQKYLQIAGLDGRAIGSKSLISFSSGLTLINRRDGMQNPAIANTDSLAAMLKDRQELVLL